MRIYKPYEALFCSFQKMYDSKDVLIRFRLQFAGFIAGLQLCNAMFLVSLYSNIFQTPIKLNFTLYFFVTMFVINGSYFNKHKVKTLIVTYDILDEKTKTINGIYSIIYVVLTFVLFIVSSQLIN